MTLSFATSTPAVIYWQPGSDQHTTRGMNRLLTMCYGDLYTGGGALLWYEEHVRCGRTEYAKHYALLTGGKAYIVRVTVRRRVDRGAAAAGVLALMEQHKVDWQAMTRAWWYPPDRVDVWEVVR